MNYVLLLLTWTGIVDGRVGTTTELRSITGSVKPSVRLITRERERSPEPRYYADKII